MQVHCSSASWHVNPFTVESFYMWFLSHVTTFAFKSVSFGKVCASVRISRSLNRTPFFIRPIYFVFVSLNQFTFFSILKFFVFESEHMQISPQLWIRSNSSRLGDHIITLSISINYEVHIQSTSVFKVTYLQAELPQWKLILSQAKQPDYLNLSIAKQHNHA